MSTPTPPRRTVFLRPSSYREHRTISDVLRTETVGGALLLGAAVLALVLANSPLRELYERVRDFHFGPEALHLHLSIGHWTADGLLAVFFFVAGVELKRELVTGDLRKPSAAILPVVAAVCGMAVPALIYTLINTTGGGEANGWAIPMATDIAFALGVLAVIGTNLPSALRAFLLTLAVVDDLGAIIVIALFYTADLSLLPLGGAVLLLALFWWMQRRRIRGWYLYLPLAVVIWALVHASGIHATVAGVAMGLLVPCLTRAGEQESPAERIEHAIRPWSAGLAVPLFALFSAGVPASPDDLAAVFSNPVGLGIVLGLFLGKSLGVFGGTWLTARFTRAELNRELAWADVMAVSVLAGIGFTVSLLIAELAFTDPGVIAEAKAAVLAGSLISAAVAAILLRLRNNRYRRLWEEENRDDNHDGIPDIYQRFDETGAVVATDGDTAADPGSPAPSRHRPA
ncbi:Na+/H+ antiporter NhaA [Allostreptomyces psammosilenae]|uniref:Na(+)/H(+) antiporter NhaA n=1 Tax=Allostreptomyces psammosilenae TaxID=1892865 RepID=A0A852ZWH9_9ACTN|nr:Na+/H+ antiporter NhaA [Allostreptomyces psammosilenae]NYI05610.1 NhaA family Na+:H+ antiporter [Allostreptomyces psammosilenae]